MRTKDKDETEYTLFNVNIPRSIRIPFISSKSKHKANSKSRVKSRMLKVDDVKPIPLQRSLLTLMEDLMLGNVRGGVYGGRAGGVVGLQWEVGWG